VSSVATLISAMEAAPFSRQAGGLLLRPDQRAMDWRTL
jgi:hypothetical protein